MKKFFILISIITFICPFFVYAEGSNVKNNDSNDSQNIDNKDSNNSTELISNAISGILIEANSGKIIYEKEKDKKVAIASMTKMVAQIIILENIENGNIKWDDVVTVSRNAADMGGSQIYIEHGEKISIYDLMRGISMASANDATVQMAEVIAGSEKKFVSLMNKKVKQLGLKNTVFKNCTGLDEDGHYSTAYDMAMIARELVVNHPKILEFSSVYEGYLRENTANKFWLVNTNKLVRYYEGADGLKTGHTDNAKYCLAATAKKNNLRLIGIVLGEEESKVRNNEAMQLLDYGFSNVKLKTIKKKGDVIKKVKLNKASSNYISIVLKNDLSVMEGIGTNKKYKYKSKINDIKLPIKKNMTVGKMYILDNGKKVASQDLVINKSVDNLSFLELLKNSCINLINGII